MAQTHIDRYELRSVIARTSMSVVYEAWDARIGRRVAIKTVSFDRTDPDCEEMLERFLRGAQAAGKLNHKNIVNIYDYAETADFAYIVMEYIDGPTLRVMLDGTSILPLKQTVSILTDVLDGLGYSHAFGIVHRDMKPANIMVTRNGIVKIADFGVAKMEQSTLTQTGTMIGTPAYMSPEQFRGEAVDYRTDIYSTGVILYQMLTGKRPYDGNPATIMRQALSKIEPPLPSSLNKAAPAPFDRVVRQAMAKRAKDRFASAAEFSEAIHVAFAAYEETVRRRTTVSQTLPQWPRRKEADRRRKIVLGAAGAVATLASVGFGYAVWNVPSVLGTPDSKHTVAQKDQPKTDKPVALVQPPSQPQSTVVPQQPAQEQTPAPAEPTQSEQPPMPVVQTPTQAEQPPAPVNPEPKHVEPSAPVTLGFDDMKRLNELRAKVRPPPRDTSQSRPNKAASKPEIAKADTSKPADATATDAPTSAPRNCFTNSSRIGIAYTCAFENNQVKLRVIGVVAGSDADVAGIRADDEIVAVNGRSVNDPATLDQLPKGAKEIEVNRYGSLKYLSLK